MEQVIKVKSNFNTFKLTALRFVMLLIAIFPLITSLFQPDKGMPILIIPTTLLSFALTIYLKIPRHVSIDSREQVVEYYWMNILGLKYQMSINISEAYILLNLTQYKGNDLWELTIYDNEKVGRTIKLMETTDGFDEQQLKYIYKILSPLALG